MLIVDNQLVMPPAGPIATSPDTRPRGGAARSRPSSSLGRAWRRMAAWDRAIQESIWGDLLALAGVVFISIGIPFIVWGFSS